MTRTRANREIWEAIERDYSAGKGSCRELALRHGVKPAAVSQRAFRQGWRVAKVEVEQAVVKNTTELVEALSKELAASRVEHLRRARALSSRFLTKLERRVDLVDDKTPTPELRALVAAFGDLLSASEVPLEIARPRQGVEVNSVGAVSVKVFEYHQE